MICTDCQKSYTGSGVRCPYCAVKFELASKAALEQDKQNTNSTWLKKAKRYRFIIYLLSAFNFLLLILTSTTWYLIYSEKIPVNTALLMSVRDYINPSGLFLQAIVAIGVLFKSRIACILQLFGFGYYLVVFHRYLGDKILHPIVFMGGIIFLLATYYSFMWHRLRVKVLKE